MLRFTPNQDDYTELYQYHFISFGVGGSFPYTTIAVNTSNQSCYVTTRRNKIDIQTILANCNSRIKIALRYFTSQTPKLYTPIKGLVA